MNNRHKSRRIVLLCVAAAVAAVFAMGSVMLGRIAEHKLHAVLANIPGGHIDFRKLQVSLLAGNLELRDVEIALCDSTETSPDIEGRIGAIRLERVRWSDLFRGEASAKRLLIRNPEARLTLPKKEAEKKDSAGTSAEASFLKKVSLSELRIEQGKIGLQSPQNPLKASAQGIDIDLRDIGILLADNHVEFNDSLYSVALDSLDYADATGLFRVQIGHLATADAGPVEALALHLYNCVGKEEVAEKMGKVASMWYDVKLDSLHTSPINLPRMANSRRIDIESIRVSGPDIVLFQDDRYPPAVPYPTMQEGLNGLDLPLHIGQVNAQIRLFTFIWETTHVNRGTFPLHNLRLAIQSVSNAPDNLMEMNIQSGYKGKGSLDMSIFTRNDKKESTYGSMRIHDLDASRLDPFLRPLFGATVKADIHQIDSRFKGDKNQMSHHFCMQYEHLSVHAWNDVTAPYQLVAKSSGAINFLAKLILPKSNPAAAGKDPKEVEVEFKRDPWLPYPSYLIQTLTTGMLHTVLPGGAVRKSKK